jgi:hypothetical protein
MSEPVAGKTVFKLKYISSGMICHNVQRPITSQHQSIRAQVGALVECRDRHQPWMAGHPVQQAIVQYVITTSTTAPLEGLPTSRLALCGPTHHKKHAPDAVIMVLAKAYQTAQTVFLPLPVLRPE